MSWDVVFTERVGGEERICETACWAWVGMVLGGAEMVVKRTFAA